MTDSATILRRLMNLIGERKARPEETSYTANLLAAGLDTLAAKLTEETGELIEAAREPGEPGREHAIREAADLVYHLLVFLAWRGVELEEVEKELARRFGVSGLGEKAARERSH